MSTSNLSICTLYFFALALFRHSPVINTCFAKFIQSTDDVFHEIRAWGGNLSFKETTVSCNRGYKVDVMAGLFTLTCAAANQHSASRLVVGNQRRAVN